MRLKGSLIKQLQNDKEEVGWGFQAEIFCVTHWVYFPLFNNW